MILLKTFLEQERNPNEILLSPFLVIDSIFYSTMLLSLFFRGTFEDFFERYGKENKLLSAIWGKEKYQALEKKQRR